MGPQGRVVGAHSRRAADQPGGHLLQVEPERGEVRRGQRAEVPGGVLLRGGEQLVDLQARRRLRVFCAHSRLAPLQRRHRRRLHRLHGPHVLRGHQGRGQEAPGALRPGRADEEDWGSDLHHPLQGVGARRGLLLLWQRPRLHHPRLGRALCLVPGGAGAGVGGGGDGAGVGSAARADALLVRGLRGVRGARQQPHRLCPEGGQVGRGQAARRREERQGTGAGGLCAQRGLQQVRDGVAAGPGGGVRGWQLAQHPPPKLHLGPGHLPGVGARGAVRQVLERGAGRQALLLEGAEARGALQRTRRLSLLSGGGVINRPSLSRARPPTHPLC
mmetsp:Transcript_30220/g.74042  ORF Transcript_30220/g.74042 Transcript_30220/m.74042 type:complete len:330 (+) Transcript_30220:277-1266(+)